MDEVAVRLDQLLREGKISKRSDFLHPPQTSGKLNNRSFVQTVESVSMWQFSRTPTHLLWQSS